VISDPACRFEVQFFVNGLHESSMRIVAGVAIVIAYS
jgi:hypothetical protein